MSIIRTSYLKTTMIMKRYNTKVYLRLIHTCIQQRKRRKEDSPIRKDTYAQEHRRDNDGMEHGQREKEYRRSKERRSKDRQEKEPRRSKDRFEEGRGEMRKNSTDRARYDTERKQEGNTRVIPPTGRGYEETMRTYHEYAEAGRERDRERERARDPKRYQK